MDKWAHCPHGAGVLAPFTRKSENALLTLCAISSSPREQGAWLLSYLRFSTACGASGSFHAVNGYCSGGFTWRCTLPEPEVTAYWCD
jgi:hypothetical protein